MSTAEVSGERLQRALELGWAFVNRRERTVTELRSHLERKGIPEATADACVGTLSEQGLLDDARFVRLFVEDKRRLEQWGADRIRRGLISRGIDRRLADAAVAAPGDGDGDGESELERAVAVLRRRWAAAPPADGRERERALGVLIRKGYGSELALDALAAYEREG
jgi:regulatory protein